MKKIAVLFLVLCSLVAAAQLGAESIWISGSRFTLEPAIQGVAFSLEVKQEARYQAKLLCRGEGGKEYAITLTLEEAEKQETLSTVFAFVGRGFG